MTSAPSRRVVDVYTGIIAGEPDTEAAELDHLRHVNGELNCRVQELTEENKELQALAERWRTADTNNRIHLRRIADQQHEKYMAAAAEVERLKAENEHLTALAAARSDQTRSDGLRAADKARKEKGIGR